MLLGRVARTVALVLAATLVACSNGDEGAATAGEATRAIRTTPGELAGTITEGFSAPRDLVELTDGRAVINDRAHRELWVVDFTTGDRAAFGRTGDGPGEFRDPSAVMRLPGDSIAVASAGSLSRISVMAPNGTPVRSVRLDPRNFAPPTHPEQVSEWLPQPVATDAFGNVYGERPRVPAALEPIPDSLIPRTIVRYDLALQRSDSVTSVWPAIVRTMPRANAIGLEFDLPLGAVEARSAWAVLADGSVAVVDESSYAITRYALDGSITVAQPLDSSRYEITADVWQQYVDTASANFERLLRGGSMMTADGSASTITINAPLKPDVLPPVIADEYTRVLTDGTQLWIPVAGPYALQRERWDVISAAGERVDTYDLPAGTRLLAVSEQYLYVTSADEDGLRMLTRYRRP